jgi:hypothetical protein
MHQFGRDATLVRHINANAEAGIRLRPNRIATASWAAIVI